MFVEIRDKIKDYDYWNVILVTKAHNALKNSKLKPPFSFNAFCTDVDRLFEDISGLDMGEIIDLLIYLLQNGTSLDDEYSEILNHMQHIINEWEE